MYITSYKLFLKREISLLLNQHSLLKKVGALRSSNHLQNHKEHYLY